MKKTIVFVLAVFAATPAFAWGTSTDVSRGGIINSAVVTQSVKGGSAGFQFSQIGQGERVTIEAPRYDPLIDNRVYDERVTVNTTVKIRQDASSGSDPTLQIDDPIGSID